MARESLVREFDLAMMGIYRSALTEANYKATRFLEMLHNHRGIDTAKILINSKNVSDGYTALYQLGRLDLTVEALVYENNKWHELFTDDELEICKKRLVEYRYIK